MADAQDSKSCGGDFVWVQVPLSAVKKNSIIKDFNDWDIYYFTIFITMVSQEVNVSFFIQKALTEDSISSASA